jgi:hypothetical protein
MWWPLGNNISSELMAWTMLKLTISVMMPLFIDFCKKIEAVEKNLLKDVLPWEQKGVKGKVITAG